MASMDSDAPPDLGLRQAGGDYEALKTVARSTHAATNTAPLPPCLQDATHRVSHSRYRGDVTVSNVQEKQFHRLIDQLGDEMGKRRGWKSVIARRIGIHRSTLVKILKGERGVTASMLERVAESLDIQPSFFSTEDAGHYEDWKRLTPAEIRAAETPYAEIIGRPSPEPNAQLDTILEASYELGARVIAPERRQPEVEQALAAVLDRMSEWQPIAAYETARRLMNSEPRSLSALESAALRLVAALIDLRGAAP